MTQQTIKNATRIEWCLVLLVVASLLAVSAYYLAITLPIVWEELW